MAFYGMQRVVRSEMDNTVMVGIGTDGREWPLNPLDANNDLFRVKVQLAAVNGEPRLHGAFSVFRGKTIRDAAIAFVKEMDIESMCPNNYRTIDLLVTCNAGITRSIRVRPVLEYHVDWLRGEGSNDEVIGNDDDTEVITADEELMIQDALHETDQWWDQQ